MPNFEESEGFKLKSGNKTSFKQMGSTPTKHLGSHPSKKDGHTHKGQGVFQRVHGALTGTEGKKFKDTKVGKGISNIKKKYVEKKTRKKIDKGIDLDLSTPRIDVKGAGTSDMLVHESSYDYGEDKPRIKPSGKNKAYTTKGEIGGGQKFTRGGGDPYQYRKIKDKFQYKKIGEQGWNDVKGGFDYIEASYNEAYPQ